MSENLGNHPEQPDEYISTSEIEPEVIEVPVIEQNVIAGFINEMAHNIDEQKAELSRIREVLGNEADNDFAFRFRAGELSGHAKYHNALVARIVAETTDLYAELDQEQE